MGEMAEYYIQQEMDAHPDWNPFATRPSALPTCMHCGKDKLSWRQIKGNWVLFESPTKQHNCAKISADELAKVWK